MAGFRGPAAGSSRTEYLPETVDLGPIQEPYEFVDALLLAIRQIDLEGVSTTVEELS